MLWKNMKYTIVFVLTNTSKYACVCYHCIYAGICSYLVDSSTLHSQLAFTARACNCNCKIEPFAFLSWSEKNYNARLMVLLNRSDEEIYWLICSVFSHHCYFWWLLGAESKVAKKVAKMNKSPDVNFGRNLQEKVAKFAINRQIWQHCKIVK